MVGQWPVRLDRIGQGEVELAPLAAVDGRRALADVVEIVLDQLVGHQRPQQTPVAASREDPEHGGPVEMTAPLIEHVQRVGTQARIRDRFRPAAPPAHLFSDRVEADTELARGGACQSRDLPGFEGKRSRHCSVNSCQLTPASGSTFAARYPTAATIATTMAATARQASNAIDQAGA